MAYGKCGAQLGFCSDAGVEEGRTQKQSRQIDECLDSTDRTKEDNGVDE